MLTEEQIALALEKKMGNITDAARALKITRQGLHKRIASSEALQAVVAEARETLVDIAESHLLKQIKKGNITAIIFTLKTQGKERGYVERQEVEHSGGIETKVIEGPRDVR